MSDEWQDIESAPKDGTTILLGNTMYVTAARWFSNKGAYQEFTEGWLDYRNGSWRVWDEHYTHWRPVPAPPDSKGK